MEGGRGDVESKRQQGSRATGQQLQRREPIKCLVIKQSNRVNRRVQFWAGYS